MTPTIWTPHVTVAAIVERDGKFLLVEEEDHGALMLNQPAGHLDEGESILDAVVRETREETAWRFTPEFLLGIYRWRNPRNDFTYIRFAFIGSVDDHDPQQTLDRGIVRSLWLSAADIAREATRHRSPQVQRCIDDYRAGRRYPLDCLHEVQR